MNLYELKPAEGAKKSKKVVGRGIGSGHGKTSTRGHKGQKSRSGGGKGPGFQGGQMPIQRTTPKRGFSNFNFMKDYAEVNIEQLNAFEAGTEINAAMLKDTGLIGKIGKDGVKVLGNGELKVSLIIKANGFTKSAAEKIVSAGGKAEVI